MTTIGSSSSEVNAWHEHIARVGDVDADGVWDDRVPRREDASDGQAITEVGIGHESSTVGNGQAAGIVHLLYGLGIDVTAPLSVASRSLPFLKRTPGLVSAFSFACHGRPLKRVSIALIRFGTLGSQDPA